MKGPTAGQKRALARVADPIAGMLFRAYRAARSQSRRRQPLDLGDARITSLVRKVLVVRLDAIGDLLLSEPALALLRQRYPAAQIDLVANPVSAAVLRGNPAIDHLISYQAPWHAAWRGRAVSWPQEVARLAGLTRTLRAEGYEVGYELRGDARDIIFLGACDPGTLVGSGFRSGGALLHYDIPVAENAHQVEMAAAIANAGSDAPPLIASPRVYPSITDRNHAAALLPPTSGPRVALHLGAGFPSKQLPIEHFAAALTTLTARLPDLDYVVVGTADEGPLAYALREQTSVSLTDLTGRLSLLETAAVLERCQLFIGNDSAPMHLAAAVGVPVVTFFGPSEPWKFHPYGVPYRLLEITDLDCRPCDYVHCVWPQELQYQCMTRQSSQQIAEAAWELLSLRQPVSTPVAERTTRDQ